MSAAGLIACQLWSAGYSAGVDRPTDPDPIGQIFWPLLGLFLGGGLLASIEALMVPRLQLALHLGYARALTVQLVYYAGYLLFALPATLATMRLGPMRAMAGAVGLVAVGCALLAMAQTTLRFAALLSALLLLSSGVTVLQIACNGLVATAGPRSRATARFTLLQGFNALGTVLGPLLAAWALLGASAHGAARGLFLLLAGGFGLLALSLLRARNLLPHPPATTDAAPARLGRLLQRRELTLGVAAIFAYVGAEVTIGSLGVAYLTLPTSLHASPVAAGQLVSLYWGGAMVGRFAGAAILRRLSPDRLLATASSGAVLLVASAIVLPGAGGATALLGIGLCNAVMFPVIYGIAMPAETKDAPLAAMLLCMAVVGGAVVPMLTGLLADRTSLRAALAVPGLCYLTILLFARRNAARPVRPLVA